MESTSDGGVRIKDQGTLLSLTRKGYDMSSLVQSPNDHDAAIGEEDGTSEHQIIDSSSSESVSMKAKETENNDDDLINYGSASDNNNNSKAISSAIDEGNA
jgi:hypothetical protein